MLTESIWRCERLNNCCNNSRAWLLQNPWILVPEFILDDIDVLYHDPGFLFPFSFLFHLCF